MTRDVKYNKFPLCYLKYYKKKKFLIAFFFFREEAVRGRGRCRGTAAASEVTAEGLTGIADHVRHAGKEQTPPFANNKLLNHNLGFSLKSNFGEIPRLVVGVSHILETQEDHTTVVVVVLSTRLRNQI